MINMWEMMHVLEWTIKAQDLQGYRKEHMLMADALCSHNQYNAPWTDQYSGVSP